MTAPNAGARPHAGPAVAGGLLLAVATPPAVLPGAEFLVLAGLMAWFAIATDRRRPVWHAYLFGCVHMAWFSWSVHHYMWFPYAAIIVIGGGYYALSVSAVRAAPARTAPLAFAFAVAGSVWLRAAMPEIYYPHGQPCHSLWQWPLLLHGVIVGGEPLVNGLLAAVAAAVVEAWRSWRIGVPAWRAAVRNAGVATFVFAAVTGVGRMLANGSTDGGPTLAVAAIEPGMHVHHEWMATMALPREQQRARGQQLLQERLLAPTRALLAEAKPPDIVLWPESSVPDIFERRDLAPGARPIRGLGSWPNVRTRLVLGANVADDLDDREVPPTPAALLFELPSGAPLGWHEKRVLVPGGEFPPFYTWVPRGNADTIVGWFEAALGRLPRATRGTERPPLQGPRDMPFGALLCYDNAFARPADAQVAMGARWLCVLSNEAWFEGGGELTQLMAMTVVRALETGTPIVRCTQDGQSGLVDARGRIAASLPIAAAPQPEPRILRVEISPGPGRLPPLAWLRSSTGPAAAVVLLALLLHGFARWARLLPVRTAAHAAAGPGSTGIARGSGS